MASLNPRRNRAARANQQDNSDQHARFAEQGVQERVLEGVQRGVSRRQRDGDNEPRGREPQQRENQQLAAPAVEQVLEHRNRAEAHERAFRHLRVHRQRAKQRDGYQQGSGNGRKRPRGEQGDARLVPERGEVIHAGEPQHEIPRVRGSVLLDHVQPPASEEPAGDWIPAFLRSER